MLQEVLFILLNEYADWEGAFLASSLKAGVMPGSPTKYIPKIVAPTREAVCSIGGFRTLPDYSFEDFPSDYAALILIGGMQWQSAEADPVVSFVADAMQRNKIIGAICNAASFMCKHGFLNHVRHTGNTLQQLKLWGGERYTNEEGYIEQQAVSDGRIVTANGTGQLEFTREILLLLEADTPENIRASYDFYKNGFVR